MARNAPTKERQRREQSTRNTRRPGRLYLIAATVLIAAALIFALTVFFRVHDMTVEGNTRNSAQAILNATGIEVGDNLFFVDLDEAADRALRQFPYLRDVSIRRVLPNKLQLTVTERQPVGTVESGGMLWVVDERGKVLESFPKARFSDAPDVPRILGVEVGEVYVGGLLTPADETLDLITPVLQVLSALEENDLERRVELIRISSGFAVTFTCGDLYTVQMQIPCDIDAKIAFLAQGLSELPTQEPGVIDLTVDKVFRFIPQSVLDLQKELASQPLVGLEEEAEADGEDQEDDPDGSEE